MTVRAVFFDLDGTLLDTSRDLGAALNSTLADEGLEPLADEITRPHVSNGANALIKLGFGESLPPTRQQALRQRLLDHYTSNIAQFTQPFDGIETLIDSCKTHDIVWGIVTNKPWPYTEQLMQYFDFASAPSAIICPDHVSKPKPAAEPLIMASEQSGCELTDVVYIGDHLRDIECGINAGAATIAVGYGFTQDPEEHKSWGADYAVDHADEIWPILDDLRHRNSARNG